MQGCPYDYRGKEFDQVWQIKYVYRKFQNTHRKAWSVFGSAQQEDFDPLAFSKASGDYPKGGTDVGGRWVSQKFQFYG